MTDEQPSVSELLNAVHKKKERFKRNRQNVAFCTAMLPEKERLLAECVKSLAYYQEIVPRLTNEIALMRKRLEFSLEFFKDHQDDDDEIREAEKIAAKIKKLEKELIALREKEAEKSN